MAVIATFKVQAGTTKTLKSSGGDGVITMTSVANAAARQSDKIDLGVTRAALYDVFVDMEWAATPTAGNSCDLYWAPSANVTAGTDNPGNATGADAAYAGYSSNLTATLPQLQFIGQLISTAQATATVQKGYAGRFSPAARYGSLIVVNNGGSAVHSSATNIQFRLVPVEGTAEA